MKIRLSILLVVAFFMQLSHVIAQATNAGFAGVVRGDNNEALIGATVTIYNNSTGFETGTITNVNGEYLIQQVPLGGPYDITVSYLGYSTAKQTGYTMDQGDQIRVDFQITTAETELALITVSGASLRNRINQIGSTTEINAQQIRSLPTEGRNFTFLTSLSPLQGAGAINLGGQRRTSTNVLVDGVNARNQLTAGEIGRGPYTISQEAIREFEVSTNDYSVVQGRQGGGAITATTKSGTNEFAGSVFVYHRNENLQSQFDIRGNERSVDFFNTQYGASLGGPIVKDKIHFFAVYERQDAGEPFTIADLQTEDDQNRVGITTENLNRFVDIARTQYGVSNDQQTGQFDRKTTANTFFARVDWQLNNIHRLTIRNNFNVWDNPFSVNDNSTITLAESWSNFSALENSTLVSLRSALSPKVLNELKVQYQHAEREFVPSSQLPSENIPRAIVNITSTLPNGTSRNLSAQIGGQRFTPETNLERNIHLTNTTYLNAGKFNFTFGTDNMFTYLETLLSNEQNGRFFYNSLDDFANNRPFRYAREVPLQGLPIVEQTVIDLGFFAQAETNLHPHLNAVFGLRWDATLFLDEAAFNPTVFEELGIRTDNKPSDLDNLQPRLQFTWNMGGKNQDIIRLGGGMFSSQPHYYAQVNNIQNSGLLLGAIDVTGNAVPVADFNAYRKAPSTVPGIPDGSTVVSTINAVSDDFEVPTIYKGNLTYTHIFNEKYSLGFNALISHTANNYVYQEGNLVQDPYFTTANEGRAVFVPAATIRTNGVTDWTNSRISQEVGRTLVLQSDGFLDQAALIIEGSARFGKDGYLNASYTFNVAKDNSSYNCCVANTSTFLPVTGDPRALNYGFSDNHFSNKLVVNGSTPTWKGLQLGASATGEGGTVYHFTVNTNTSVNGDFVQSNDVAYIFDPTDASTPQAIIDGYNTILNNPDVPQHYKDYLKDSYGQFAERNAGRNPFQVIYNLRLTYDLKFGKTKNGLELSADLFNVANLLNKEWGRTFNYGRENRIMRATGFNQETQQYNYTVNTGVATEPINGTPWRLQLGVRYKFN